MEHRTKGPTAKGPAERFTGEVWLDPVAEAHGATPTTVSLVHFTPGSRTAWHSHEVGQTLYVMEGQGRVQSRGEEVVDIRAGDVVVARGGEWHWHGAAPDHLMTHIAVSEGQSDWGEHVSDADYRGEAS